MKAHFLSEKGIVREENQDAILARITGESGLFVVADGVGGSQNGALASNLIVDTYNRWWEDRFKENMSFFDAFEEIKEAAQLINETVFNEYGTSVSASTLALLFVHKKIYGVISIGDSRVYYCNQSGTQLITRDDTLDNLPNNEMGIGSGQLISAIGRDSYLEFSSKTDQLKHKDLFFLCSDGVYKYIAEEELFAILASMQSSLLFSQKGVTTIERIILTNETQDNYSMIAVRI